MTRRSLHIGVAAPGWDAAFKPEGQLRDHARQLSVLAADRGFDAVLLDTPETTTWASVWTELSAAVEAVREGGDLFITFVGHGTVADGVEPKDILNPNPCEARTKQRELWVLQDRALSDADFRTLLARVGPDANIVCLSDACFGLGMAPFPPLIDRIKVRVGTAIHKFTRAILERLWDRIVGNFGLEDPKSDRYAIQPLPVVNATAAFFSPAAETRQVEPGFSPNFVRAVAQAPHNVEELRQMAERLWNPTGESPRRVCLRKSANGSIDLHAFFRQPRQPLGVVPPVRDRAPSGADKKTSSISFL